MRRSCYIPDMVMACFTAFDWHQGWLVDCTTTLQYLCTYLEQPISKCRMLVLGCVQTDRQGEILIALNKVVAITLSLLPSSPVYLLNVVIHCTEILSAIKTSMKEISHEQPVQLSSIINSMIFSLLLMDLLKLSPL